MTIGEKIQKYRRDLGLSQEELSKMLLVSPDTINLWETNESVPTIDNLKILRNIFKVSVDDILGFTNTKRTDENLPNETYRFHFDKDELKAIHRLQIKTILKRPIIFTLICVLLIALFIVASAPEYTIGFTSGMFLIGVFSYIKGIIAHSKTWKGNINIISKSTYEYKFFNDYIDISIYRENEKVRWSKCFFSDIEQIHQFYKWIFLQFGGQTFILRKKDLKDFSVLFSHMYKSPTKVVEITDRNKWKGISILLFVASLVSIFGALILWGILSTANGLFVENMWAFLAMTPIPITSIVFGFVLNSKGYSYKKNIIVGFIVTFFLCIYGSFVFIL